MTSCVCHSVDMATNETLVRLAELVLARRDELSISREAAARLADINRATLRRVEEALPVRATNYAAIAEALGWPRASINAFLAGGPEPRPEEESPQDFIASAPDPVIERMLDAVKAEHPEWVYRWAAQVVAERRSSGSTTRRNGGTAV